MTVMGDAADGFFYDLLRDHLPAGTVEAVLREAEAYAHEELEFSNQHLARYAKEVRHRLDVAVQRNRKSVLDLDFIRKNHTKIHFFGLGFIQVKMQDDSRYHFYHPELEPFAENPHDHRYHFTSTVLKGTLENRIWKILSGPALPPTSVPAVSRFDSCSKDVSPPDTRTPVDVEMVSTFKVTAGSSYFIDESTFHQVSLVGSEPCVTHLKRGPKTKEFSTVLLLNGKEEACPFSKNLGEFELWDIVRESVL